MANKGGFLAKKKYESELMWDLELSWLMMLEPPGLFFPFVLEVKKKIQKTKPNLNTL